MKKTPSESPKIAKFRHSDGKTGISDDNWFSPEEQPVAVDEKK
jgi:hypothetical protein